jgi:hypothetical protein
MILSTTFKAACLHGKYDLSIPHCTPAHMLSASPRGYTRRTLTHALHMVLCNKIPSWILVCLVPESILLLVSMQGAIMNVMTLMDQEHGATHRQSTGASANQTMNPMHGVLFLMPSPKIDQELVVECPKWNRY